MQLQVTRGHVHACQKVIIIEMSSQSGQHAQLVSIMSTNFAEQAKKKKGVILKRTGRKSNQQRPVRLTEWSWENDPLVQEENLYHHGPILLVCVCVCMERCGIVHCFGSTECTHIDQRNYWLLIVRNIILSYIKSVVTSPHSGWQLIMRAGLISPGSTERGFGSGCALILPIGVPMKQKSLIFWVIAWQYSCVIFSQFADRILTFNIYKDGKTF